MTYIKRIKARQILDSRGNPTVEVDVVTTMGSLGRASAPSGASTGVHEALEIRDHKSDYCGKSVQKAVNNVNNILQSELIGCSVDEQSFIDKKMLSIDGTLNKSNLGANAILPVSIAVAKAAALDQKIGLYQYIAQKQFDLVSKSIKNFMLPVPMMNIINGGAHADNRIDIQEFMIIPVSAKSFSDSLQIGAEVFYSLKKMLQKKDLSTNVGDEGGFAPDLSSTEDALDLILSSIEKAGYSPGLDVAIALDAAASEFYDKETKEYCLYSKDSKKISKDRLSSSDMVSFWQRLVANYPIISIEDALDEDDWVGWREITRLMGDKVQLVGDDLFVTNTSRLDLGVKQKVANSILIKLNQIGTLTETLSTINMAHENNFTTVISHRSGETEDVTISDLAVGCCAGQIKTGSVSRSDRVAKYNQLLRIEEELAERGYYDGFPQPYLTSLCGL